MTSSAPLYDYSIVPFKNTLQNMVHVLERAEKHAQEKGEDVESYTKLQIYPDMRDFTDQIQRASDAAKFAYTRLSKATIDPKSVALEDNETTFQQLKDRVTRTIAILDEAKAEDFLGQETKTIELFGGKVTLSGQAYLQKFALPNFFFHTTTAYDLLRGQGVPIGKTDYLAGSQSL